MDLELIKQRIKRKGFHYIKFELEADTGRDTDGCWECGGSGQVFGGYDEYTDCDYCDGTGGGNDDTYLQAIRDRLSAGACDAIEYAKVYYDGSVDTELTCTIPVDKIEYLPEFVEAFRDVAPSGLSVGDAGLHISVMQQGDYGRGCLEPVYVRNFYRQMPKLLPALFCLASCDYKSRALNYRTPRVSDNKYSAIHEFSGGLEFRLFETCYQRPEAILDYVAVIAKCLRYYSKSVRAPKAFSRFQFNEHDDRLIRFYRTSDNMKALRATLAEIAPDGKTIEELLKERRLNVSAKRLAKMEAKERNAYADYVADFKANIYRELKEEARQVARNRKRTSYFELNTEEFRKYLIERRDNLMSYLRTPEQFNRYDRNDNYTVTV